MNWSNEITLNSLKKDPTKFIYTLTAHPYGHKSLGKPREVVTVQPNAIKFNDGAWLYWPKASECSFFISSGDVCFSINLNGRAMTYQLTERKGN